MAARPNAYAADGALARARQPSTCSGRCSCCPRRRCCCSSSPIRSGSAPGSASPTPRSAAPAQWIGLENFEYLWGDAVTRLALFNTLFYTIVASVIKFVLGLWLALLLNKHLPFKAFLRAIVLLPFIVPTALSAIAFWWIYDSQFSIISWALMKMGLIHEYIDFLGQPWHARFSTIAANIWRGVPFVAITLLAGLQTISPSYYEAASLDGASPWQQFRYVTLPLLTPIIAVVMTFSVLFTFTDFQLIYVLTRGGPLNCDAPDGHAVVPARDLRRQPGRGRGDRDGDGAVPAGGDPVQLLRPAAPRLAAGRGGQMTRRAPTPPRRRRRRSRLAGDELPRRRCRAGSSPSTCRWRRS